MSDQLFTDDSERFGTLPSRIRVHELAKRFGVSSRRLLEEINAQGTAVASPSSSVSAEVARGALGALEERGELTRPTAPSDQSQPTTETPAGVALEAAAPAEAVPGETGPTEAGDGAPAASAPVQTPAQRTVSTDLPERPRVHQLAKRAGVSTGQVVAALAAIGVNVTSPQSVVNKTAALEALAALGAGVDVPAEPPAETGASTGSDADEAQAGEAEGGGEAGTAPERPGVRRGRRRRGGRRGRAHGDQGETTEHGADDAFEDRSEEEVGAPDQASADSGETPFDEAEPAETEDGIAPEPTGGPRSRRRRRRSTGSARPDVTATEVGPEAGPEVGEEGPVAGPEGEPDEGEESEAEGTARRRRRRRRGSSDEAPRTPDDPADTVLHVRDARSAEAQVQGVRGSTRLEAKRQRRRENLQTRRRPQILTEAEFLARRESVNRVMAVRQRGELTQVALLEDGVLVEHFVSRAGSASMIGNIYLGRVQNVLPSMEAAFVDIGRGRNAVLYAGEVNWEAAGLAGKSRRIETALSSGDMVLVQVSKDPVGHKGARLTTQISLPGRFLVYVPSGGATGISRKLPDTERRRLKAILDRIVPSDAGVIIRTAAEGVDEDELARDVERLKSQWSEIEAASAAKQGSAAKQLYGEPDTLIKVVRDLFNSDINELVIDGDEAWQSLSSYVTSVAPELAPRMRKYTGPTDVFAAHRIDEQIAKALERKVFLPSGGSLVIDRTEAMTVVDVNTGKYTGSGGNLEETVTKNNLEAAEEVVRQLRLRDIGGIIVIDFIDMVLESNRDLVLRRLTECLGRDRTRHQVAEVTSLGLVQMTRKKLGTGLVEAFSEPCPHCQGRGILLLDMPVDVTPDDGSDQVSDRNGRRRRARPQSEPEAIPQVATPRRDPRGPKPPNEHEHLAPDTPVSTSDADPAEPTIELSRELVAELRELSVVPADAEEVEVSDAAGPEFDGPLAVEGREHSAGPRGSRASETAAGEVGGAPDGGASETAASVAPSREWEEPDSGPTEPAAVVLASRPQGQRRRRAASRPAGPPAG